MKRLTLYKNAVLLLKFAIRNDVNIRDLMVKGNLIPNSEKYDTLGTSNVEL
jgi:hypothetical protein